MHVLLAIDQSASSEAAVAFLTQQPLAEPADLEIISVIPPLPFVDVSGGGALGVGMIPDVSNFLAEEHQLVQSTLDATAAKLRDRFRSVRTVIKVGSPDREIRSYADTNNVDLVVLGAVGHSAVGRILLGSVSDYVATHTQASALVIRPPQPHLEAQSSQAHSAQASAAPSGTALQSKLPVLSHDLTAKRILLAVGATGQDTQLVNRLDYLKLAESTEIHLVHVAQLMTFFRQDLKEQTSNYWMQSRAAALEHLSSLGDMLTRRGFNIHTALLSESHIGEAILVYAQEHQCDLILACDQRRSVLDRAVLGSTSRYLLRHAHRSVLIVRTPATDSASA